MAKSFHPGLKRGFTLIEILVVVAIIGVLTAGALTTLVSGRSAAHARDASRGVVQMSHYAAALALLRQRPALVTYAGGTITVQLSGKSADLSEIGAPAMPIYEEVEGQTAPAPQVGGAAFEEAEPDERPGASAKEERTGLFFTRQVLDPEELAKEDAERTFRGVAFTLELLNDEGQELDEETGTRIRNRADSIANTRSAVSGWSNVRGRLEAEDLEAEEEPAEKAKPQRVVFETNGNCTPHRILVRETEEEGGQELMAVYVSRSGKVTVGTLDEKELEEWRRSGRLKRR